jgi:small conductance mechanosensitive channel
MSPTPAPADAAKPVEVAAKSALEQIVADPVSATSNIWNQVSTWAMAKGPGILAACFLLFVAYLASRWVRNLIIAGLTRARMDLTLAKFMGNLAKWAIIIFALVTCAGTFGINTTGFAAAIGAAGLAVGLALQGNLGNLACGVLLLIFRPFKIGDAVIVAGQSGIVDGIDLFTTNLDTADNRRIIVPNGAIFSGVIENQTYHPKRAMTVTVGVSPGADMDQTRALFEDTVKRVASETKGALTDPAPAVALADLTPAVMWTMTVWASTAHAAGVRQALLREVKRTLDKAAIAPGPPVQHLVVKELPLMARMEPSRPMAS